MKAFRLVILGLLILGFAPMRLAVKDARAAQKALTNQDVVDLVKTGLSSEIIVAKIKTSACQFDTSTAGLKGLKDAGVPDAVIVVMVDPSAKSAGMAGAAKAVLSDAESAHVRIYRPRFLPGSNFNSPITVDDMEVIKLGNDRRCSIRITPGHHVIISTDKSSRIEIDAKAGQEYFISVQQVPGGLRGRGKLTMVAVEQGRPEYKLAKPLEDDKKTAKDMIENDAESVMPAAK